MALIGNYSVLTKGPGRFLGGSTTSAEVGVRSNWTKSGAKRGRLYVDQSTAANYTRAEPAGYYPPYTYFIPQISGELGTSSRLSGAGSVTASGALGIGVEASLSGAGLLEAIGQLVVSATANLSGGGGITAADLRGFLLAAANLSGGGTLAATVRADAKIGSAVSGEGTVSTSSVVRATGALAANILAYGALTPEGIRDSIWGALAASYNTTGTMGQKLNSAASGGIDYTALSDAVWEKVIENGLDAQELLRVMTAALTGTSTGTGTLSETYKSGDGSKSRIAATYDAQGNRTAIVLDATP